MSLKLRKLSESGAESAAETRNKPSRLLQLSVIAVVAIVVYVAGLVLNYSPSAARQQPTPTVTPMLQVVITPTVELTPTPTMLPAMDVSVLRNDDPLPTVAPVVIEVTSTPTPTPVYFYVPVEVEVERIVTQTLTIEAVPTATPALSPGTVRICADVEGASALYVGGLGIVSGGCQVFSFGVGQTSIQVQVNK